jgi:hypothetical protein
MAPQFFVYYRVRSDHVPAAVAALRALHGDWQREEPALGCELMRRVDGGDPGPVTLMEIYRHAGGVAPAWQQRIEREARAALAPWLVGERHVEVFAPCA